MERREWRRFVAVILSALMIIGIINIPGDVVHAETDECYIVTYDGNGNIMDITYDPETQEEHRWATVDVEVKKGSKINYKFVYPYVYGEHEKDVFVGYKLKDSDTLYVVRDGDIELKEGEKVLNDFVPESDVTFYAEWKEGCDITFNGNGGYMDDSWNSETEQYDYIESVTRTKVKGERLGKYEPRPFERDGYIFKGYKVEGSDTLYVLENKDWYELKEGEAFFSDYVPESDVTFYAQWAEAWTVTFDSNGGAFYYEQQYESDELVPVTTESVKVEKGTKLGENWPHYGERENYISYAFKKDDSDTLYVFSKNQEDLKAGEELIDEYVPTDDVTFRLQWTVDIVLDPGKGSIFDKRTGEKWSYAQPLMDVLPKSGGYQIGDSLSLSTECRKDGMVFDGWESKKNGKIYKTYEMLSLSTADTFTAHYSDAIVVSLEIGDMGYYSYKSGPKSSEKYYSDLWLVADEDGKIDVSNYRFGSDEYAFADWNRKGTHDFYKSDELNDIVFTDDAAFIPNWGIAHKVTFYSEEGYMQNSNPNAKEYEELVLADLEFSGTIPVPAGDCTTRRGYYVDYWTLDGDDKEYRDADIQSMVVEGDLTFTAHWAKAATVNYDANGGKISYGPQSVEKLSTYAAYRMAPPKYDVSKEGSVFGGWLIEDDSELSGSVIKNLSDYVVNGDVTFTAQWGADCSEVGHTEEEIPAVVPTCTEKGYTAGKKCSVCGEILVEPQEQEALGHSMTKNMRTEATCIMEGNEVYWSCSNCKKYFSDKDGNNEIEKNSWKIPPKGHNYGDLIEEVPAKCTEDGVKAHYECSGCGKKYVKDGSDYVEVTDAQLRIPQNNHTEITIEAEAATCTKPGHTAGKKCSVCGEVLEEPQEQQALGHNMTNHTATPVKCLTDGNSEYWSCDRCNKYFSDKDGNNEIEKNSWIITHIGHKEEEIPAVAPTCTKKGHTAGKICSRCKEVLEGVEELDKVAHNPVTDYAVEATTEKTGLTEGSHCSVCGYVIKRQEVVPKKEDPNKKAEEEAKKKAEEEARKKAEEEAKKKAEEEAKKKEEESKKTDYSNEWVDGKWYDANGVNNYTGTLEWKSDGSGWWVQDTDNWYPADAWQKIDGVWYYFKPDGYMATGEYYNGYWFNADGSWDPQYNLSWMSNVTGWWVEDISGWWPSDAWLKIDGCWYYFDGNGYMVSNCYVDGYWIGADGVCR